MACKEGCDMFMEAPSRKLTLLPVCRYNNLHKLKGTIHNPIGSIAEAPSRIWGGAEVRLDVLKTGW